MKIRIIVGLIIVAITFPSLYLGGVYLDILIAAIILLIGDEIARLVLPKHSFILSIFIDAAMFGLFFCSPENIVYYLAFVATVTFVLPIIFKDFTLTGVLAMIVLIFLMSMAMTGIRSIRVYSVGLTLLIVIANYTTDIFAYVFGMKFGKHKLIPEISPKKTVEGAIAGWVGSFIVIFVGKLFFLTNLSWLITALLAVSIPIVAEIGDLAFSYIKRGFNIKDFSSLMPGHGGVLDRLDSLIFVLVFISFLMHTII